jgi:hypothetical protein
MLLMGAFRSQLMAGREFSLNLWKNENIAEYNRRDLVGLLTVCQLNF